MENAVIAGRDTRVMGDKSSSDRMPMSTARGSATGLAAALFPGSCRDRADTGQHRQI